MTARRASAWLLATTLTLAACGSNGDSPSSSDADQALEDFEAELDEAGQQLADDLEGLGGDEPSDGLDGTDLGDLDDVFSGDCAEAVAAFQGALAQTAAAFIPGQGAELGDTADLLEDFADAAPAEIADDFTVFAETLGGFADALDDAGIDFSDPQTFTDPAAQETLEDLGTTFDTPELEQASENLESWFNNNCG